MTGLGAEAGIACNGGLVANLAGVLRDEEATSSLRGLTPYLDPLGEGERLEDEL